MAGFVFAARESAFADDLLAIERRRFVLDLCAALRIPLSPAQTHGLDRLSAAELEDLLRALAEQRAWPQASGP